MPAEPVTVTLVTGEKVRVDTDADGTRSVTEVTPGGGAAEATLAVFESAGDVYAIPPAAVPYVGGALDPLLFNVSYLSRARLDDAHTPSVPVTITETLGNASTLPAVHVTSRPRPTGNATGGTVTATITKSGAAAFGDLLGTRWRATRDGRSSTPVGRLAGFGQIRLAAPADAPPRPAAPSAPTVTAQASPGLPFHTLTVDLADLTGAAGSGVVLVQNVDDLRLSFFAVTVQGRFASSVPAGRYSLTGVVPTPHADGDGFDTALVVKPELTVDRAMSVHLDARGSVPYEVSLDRQVESRWRLDWVIPSRISARGGGASYLNPQLLRVQTPKVDLLDGPSRVLVHPTDNTVTTGQFGLGLHTSIFAPVDADPAYHLVFPVEGGIPQSLTYHVSHDELTAVRRDIHRGVGSAECDRPRLTWSTAHFRWGGEARFFETLPPGSYVDYWYTSEPARTTWQTEASPCGLVRRSPLYTIEPGGEIREVWNKGPAVPSVVAPRVEADLRSSRLVQPLELALCAACRQDDNAMLFVLPGADSDPGHHGSARLESRSSGALRFYRDGELALSAGAFGGRLPPQGLNLPMLPDPATYRLEWTYHGLADPQAHTTAAWTFRSGRSDPAADLPDTTQCPPDTSRGCSFLPLLFVNYDLPLGIDSTARAGAPFEIPFVVSHQQDQAPPTGLSATVSVSYDDGATWSTPVAATPQGDRRFTTTVTHPPLADTTGAVSLRVHVRDGGGNAVELTTVRSYQLTD